MYNFEYLPVEVQAQIKALQTAGASERMLESLIDSILRASEAKTTSLQLELEKIHNSINRQVNAIGDKLTADNTAHHGASNQMLIDIRSIVQNQGAAVDALRAEFQQTGERLSGIEFRTVALEATAIAHDRSRDQSIDERRLLRQDMDASKAHRAQLQETLDTELPDIQRQLTELAGALRRVEEMLEFARDTARDAHEVAMSARADIAEEARAIRANVNQHEADS